MTTIDDGGPAFPCHTNPAPGRLVNAPQGMTLRDWFAGMALSGILSDPNNNGNIKLLAGASYNLADAMLAARKGDQP